MRERRSKKKQMRRRKPNMEIQIYLGEKSNIHTLRVSSISMFTNLCTFAKEDSSRTLKLLEKLTSLTFQIQLNINQTLTLTLCHLLFIKNPNNASLIPILTISCLLFKHIILTIKPIMQTIKSRVQKLSVITIRLGLKSIRLS